MLRLAAGIDEPDRGVVGRKRGLSLGLLAQESHFDAAFMASPDLRSAVRTGAAHLDVMARELAELERDHRVTEPQYADLQHRFEVLGGYTLDQRVDATLSGLGFTRDEWTKGPSALSGGEQTRAALARLVIADPDLLLLDEPTNHLDLDALEWLEEHLRRRAGSLIVASHDRAFLDATVTRVWELRDRKLTVFRGDYSAYHRQRVERDARLEKDVETQADSIAREQELVQRYRSHRKFAKMHEHEARLERLRSERIETPKAGRRLKLGASTLAGAGPARSGEIVVRVEDLVVGYLPRFRREAVPAGSDSLTEGPLAAEPEAVDGQGPAAAPTADVPPPEPLAVARIPFLAAQRGERIGIVGPNGAGKTTLLRTIAGELPPLDGSLTIGAGVSIGYLAQLRGAAIPGATVLDALLEAIPVTPGEARGYLARFLFRGDDAFKEVRTAVRRRAVPPRAGAPRDHAGQPAPPRRADEPPRHPGPRGDRGVPARDAGDAPRRSATTAACSRPCATGCGSSTRGLAAPFDGGYRAWRAASPTAGRSPRRSRPRPGACAPAVVPWPARSSRGRRPGTAARGRGRRSRAAPGPDRRSSPARPARPGRAAPPPPAARPRSRHRSGPRPASRSSRRTRTVARRRPLDAELTRLGLRKNHLELAMGDPAVARELRRAAPDLERARRRRARPWRSPRRPGCQLEERAP